MCKTFGRINPAMRGAGMDGQDIYFIFNFLTKLKTYNPLCGMEFIIGLYSK